MMQPIIGRLLVAAQFALIAWLIWPFTPQSWPIAGSVLLGLAVALGLWTLVYNRPGNFNIRPEPKAAGQLVTGGPYRLVRHPMYVAVLLVAAAEVFSYGDTWKALAWAALLAVLWLKSEVEEAALRGKYPEYAAYAAKVGRFVPGL